MEVYIAWYLTAVKTAVVVTDKNFVFHSIPQAVKKKKKKEKQSSETGSEMNKKERNKAGTIIYMKNSRVPL